MSVSNAVGTAAAVVGVGVAAAIGYKVFESARTAGALNSAAGDIRAAGGDPSALANLMAALRSTGVLSPGEEGAAVSQGTNEQTQIQTSGVLYAAERTMLAAGSGARLSPNLTVVRPRDVYANWSIGEGAWLPSQGLTAGWRDSPTVVVRGLDMNSYAVVLLDDVYTTPSGSWRICAVDASSSSIVGAFSEKNKGRKYRLNIKLNTGSQKRYDIFITSTDQQGGLVAFWDGDRGRFLTPAEAQNVKFCVYNIDATTYAANGDIRLESAFIGAMYKALERHTKFQPFPPSIRGQQASAQATAQVQRRNDGTAVR